ncbi:MAG TPA: efflux transporter outer membrane subunit [Rhizobacter sp.]|nr:efflux transporter outer membrane subunit [Rhizobacter sp.]
MSTSCKLTLSDAAARHLPALSTLVVALASTLVLTLAGCASTAGIDPSAAKPVTPATLGAADADAAAPIATEWWKNFGDDKLSALVTQALEGNPNLKVAQARLARAQSATDITRSADGPQVNLSAEAMRQRYTTNGMVPAPLAGNFAETGTVQFNASWELDFFGRNRAAIEAAVGTQRAIEADVQAARVLLATNVARTYLQLARQVELREVTRRTLAQREETLALIRQRVQAGLDTQVELKQGESLLPETRLVLEGLEEQITLTRHALAALTAQAPQALDQLTPQLTAVQAVPLPASVPADLLGRRADISAARWRVEAATSDVAVARAQFYPNINLVAFAGVSSIGLDRLFRSTSEQYGVGPAIRLPIFDSGRLRANLRGRSADLDAAVETYNATVIDAVRDVADQITSLQSIARQQTEQAAAQVAAEAAYDLAVQRYKAGLGTYLTVLNAESNVLTQRRAATELKTRAVDTQVALIRALGGGYTTPDTRVAAAR